MGLIDRLRSQYFLKYEPSSITRTDFMDSKVSQCFKNTAQIPFLNAPH